MISSLTRGLIGAASIALAFAAVPAQAAWTSFHGDARNSGFCTNDAPFDSLLAWTVATGDSIVFSSPVVGADGRLYVGTLGDRLLALSPQGDHLWSYSAGGNFRHSTPAIAADGSITIASADGVLHAVNPNGSARWTLALPSTVKSSPKIAADGTIYIGAENGRLYAVNATGTLRWSYLTGGAIRTVPAIANDGTVLFGSLDGKLYALHANGTLRWSALTNGQLKFSSPTVTESGVVYFGSYDGFLYAVTLDQTFLWAYPTGHVLRSSPAIGPLGQIYIGVDSKLIALLPDGTLAWEYDTGGEIYSSPVYFGDDDVVCVGSDSGVFHCLRADGQLDWTFTVGSQIRTVPCPAPSGHIYVADAAGTIWAMGAPINVAAPESALPVAGLGVRPTRNPAIGSVTFEALDQTARQLDLLLYDVAGRHVVTLPGGDRDARLWNGLDAEGRRAPAGTYLYRLQGSPARGAGRLTLLR
ncbi:hypothetical protein FJ251_04155 [bacterium]|nr:hypothetical protein [bacterium]